MDAASEMLTRPFSVSPPNFRGPHQYWILTKSVNRLEERPAKRSLLSLILPGGFAQNVASAYYEFRCAHASEEPTMAWNLSSVDGLW